MKEFSKAWISSKNPGKQRKYRYNAPLHIKNKFISSHLSKELKKKYGIRSISLRKGDKVKVVRGSFKSKVGKIDRIDIKRQEVFVTGVEIIKKEGSKAMVSIDASNLIITELNLEDKKRRAKLEGKQKTEKKK